MPAFESELDFDPESDLESELEGFDELELSDEPSVFLFSEFSRARFRVP